MSTYLISGDLQGAFPCQEVVEAPSDTVALGLYLIRTGLAFEEDIHVKRVGPYQWVVSALGMTLPGCTQLHRKK